MASPPDAVAEERFMRRALRLARRGLGRTSPNPVVGCVIAHRGRVLAEGWHRRAGGPHAEAAALSKLGGRAPGATLYSTLEPCNHAGRTGPCTEAILGAGVARVAYAVGDPLHGGGGRELEQAGVEVGAGLMGGAAARDNEAWLTAAARGGRPFVSLKLAVSLDGRLGTRTGDSRWVSGEASRGAEMALRDQHDAVMVGTRTLMLDDPRLTCRRRGGRHPVRVALDRGLRCPPEARILGEGGPTLLVAARGTPGAAPSGAEALRVPADAMGRLDLVATLGALAGRGIVSVLVEGGGVLAGSLLAAGLVDRVHAFVAPILLGADGVAMVAGPGPASVADALRLRDVRSRRRGDDIHITGRSS